MEVRLTPEQETELSRIAQRTGQDIEELAQNAIDRLLKDEARVIEAAESGFASLDCGEYVEHEEVERRIERLFHS